MYTNITPRHTGTRNRVPRSNSACVQCGAWIDTGIVSCCATDGSWFGMCGPRSKGFKYSWNDGIKACKRGNGGAVMRAQAQAFNSLNSTQVFDAVQQEQPTTDAASNTLLHGIIIAVLALITTSMY